PDRVDWIEAIRAWVEDGRAPERLLATKLDGNGQVTMTRPACPYPQVAVYDGSGDPHDAASFACAAPASE
ncbi:MAG: tannase/feruloyl esterase family alpha/beta hydrolase, partial [Acidobacteria bacterium]|nr:tannase/feruloyl esterase family alpha/beta hydrolase [Acidobacteriota bacterium]